MVRLADVLPGLLNKIRSLMRFRHAPRLMASGAVALAAVYLYRAIKRRRQRPSLCDRLGGTPGKAVPVHLVNFTEYKAKCVGMRFNEGPIQPHLAFINVLRSVVRGLPTSS
ncbi:hypothetical protein FOZ60_001206, partial [Perkinsus olseni]